MERRNGIFTHAFSESSTNPSEKNGVARADTIFLALAPQVAGITLEVPMEHVAKTVEAVFREFGDDRLMTSGLAHSELKDLIEKTGYIKHMNGIKLVIEYGSRG